jgi:molybdenum cofactor cytidylyltransferase
VKTGAVILAAGKARRFGGEKLLAALKGQPVIDHVLDAVAGFPFHAVTTVVRPDSRLPEHLKDRAVIPVVNPLADQGMGTSLAAGIAALPPVDAAFVVLGDMPAIPTGLFSRMTAAMETSAADIVVPVRDGRQGHPVLFARRCFADLTALRGDAGAKAIIRSGGYTVVPVETDDPGVLRDIDLPGDLEGF